LKAGAKYRLLGSNPVPDLLNDPTEWDRSAPKRLSLNFETSSLASQLCIGDTKNCQPQGATQILAQDIECDGIECAVLEPRTIEVSPGIWYEYVRPACVNTAFYNDPKTLYRNWGDDKHMCGNPQEFAASTACCIHYSWGENARRNELFSGERVDFNTAQSRCQSQSLELCNNPWITNDDCNDPSQGGCDQWSKWQGVLVTRYNFVRSNPLAYQNFLDLWYWSWNNCTLYIKINLEGSVALVHEHGIPGISDTSKSMKRIE
jgi:hypothetical protein